MRSETELLLCDSSRAFDTESMLPLLFWVWQSSILLLNSSWFTHRESCLCPSRVENGRRNELLVLGGWLLSFLKLTTTLL